jgi:5,10-methylenetetrahydromethanopterin reductase
MARDFATIQEIAAGRLILGIGASWRPPIEAQGIEWTKPLSAVADAVHIVRELLDGQTSTFAGKKFSTSGVALSFDPPPGRSMIHVGAMFPRSLEQAARIADGVILSILCPITYVRKVQQTIDEAVGLAGSPERFEVVQYLPMQMSEDGDTARDSVKRYIAFFIRHSYGSDPEHWRKVAELGEFDIAEFEHVYRRLTDGRRPEDAVDDSFLDRFGVAGTPSHCLDLLAEYRAAGTTEPVALFPPWANLERQVEMVASDLLPQWNLLL